MAPLLIFPRGYLLKSFPQGDTSAKQRGFGIRVFLLIGELPKATEPHLPVYQLYHQQLSPTKWSSPTTKSLDPIIVTTLRVDFPGEVLDLPQVDLPVIVRCQRRGQRRPQGIYMHTYIKNVYDSLPSLCSMMTTESAYCLCVFIVSLSTVK